MDYKKYQNICVFGFGKSGIGAAKLALSLGKNVKITDSNKRSKFLSSEIKKLGKKKVLFEFAEHTSRFLENVDLIIVSPGINIDSLAVFKYIKKKKIPVVSEIEFASWFCKAKIIAITGTNGKTTTTSLIYHLLKNKFKNKKVFCAGNIGTAFSSIVLKTKEKDLVVLEISSFQLEKVKTFRPFVACLLNIGSDHMDRYSNIKDYLNAKLNIFSNQKSSDWAVINNSLNLSKGQLSKIKAKILRFGNNPVNENYSACCAVGKIFNISQKDCLKIISTFKNLAHRCQKVRVFKGVEFINDSKATNPCSTIWALKNIKKPVILIAGGRDKDLDFSEILPFIKNVKKVNLFGESAKKIEKQIKNKVETVCYKSLKEIVVGSFKDALKIKAVVLFSPMCASFDMFKNYKDRGEKFIRVVKNLK